MSNVVNHNQFSGKVVGLTKIANTKRHAVSFYLVNTREYEYNGEMRTETAKVPFEAWDSTAIKIQDNGGKEIGIQYRFWSPKQVMPSGIRYPLRRMVTQIIAPSNRTLQRFVGRLTANPKTKLTKGSKKNRCWFTLAHNTTRELPNGTLVDEVIYVAFEAYNDLATTIASMKQGDKVAISFKYWTPPMEFEGNMDPVRHRVIALHTEAPVNMTEPPVEETVEEPAVKEPAMEEPAAEELAAVAIEDDGAEEGPF